VVSIPILSSLMLLCSPMLLTCLDTVWDGPACHEEGNPYSDGLNLYFSALTAHFGQWLEVGRRGRKARRWLVAAELIYGQVKKSYRRRKLLRVTHVMRLGTLADLTVARASDGFLWTAEYRVHRASEPVRPTWSGGFGASYLGDGPAGPSPPGPLGMVASVLSFCASPRCSPDSTRAAGSREEVSWWRNAIAIGPKPMAAGSTNRRWTAREVLSYPLPPAPSFHI
jgi:hypothetical protein